MKKLLLITLIMSCFKLWSQGEIVVKPAAFEETEEIEIVASALPWTNNGTSDDVYLWAWHFDNSGTQINNPPAVGTDFGNSPETAKFVNNGDGTYSYKLTPTAFYNNTGITRIGVLAKSKDGSSQTMDVFFNVGSFQVILENPSESTVLLDAPGNFRIKANASLPADFTLSANGTEVNTQSNMQEYVYDFDLNANTNFLLTAKQVGGDGEETISFSALLKPTSTEAPVPAGMEDGFNYNAGTGEATWVFFAPQKEFVHLIGNFKGNDWEVDNTYLMNKDSSADRFWLTMNFSGDNLEDLLYQYLVEYDIRVADPYATLVLDQFNDSFIPSETFPDIPNYPTDKTSNLVSWVQLDEEAYQWQTENFSPPAKTDLVIYELLVRDFDEDQNYQDIIDRLDYLENLGINAIELMPVQEFDGNNSWGYNPALHMALDKNYGTRKMLKTLVDEAHARGIAVILDVVYNHATGQNPYFRMYNTSDGGTGGVASADSPFFNSAARHSFNVFNDFDHSSDATRQYVERTAQYWIDEFRIDGYRWDLTKGFTQNCTGSNQFDCTQDYNADRVEVLKTYADYQWEANDDFYIIFEHLGSGGSATEEKEWANYRNGEGKGILLWNKQTDPYNDATMGFSGNISGASYKQKGFDQPAVVSYMESHDEERLMYKNLRFGNNSSNTHNVRTLPIALKRMEAAGAFFFTIPGPKMIWQFGELGYNISIFACSNGTVPEPYGTDNCKLSEKPDGWDYLQDANRKAVYDTWSRLIALKTQLPIFETETFTLDVTGNNGLKKIRLTDPDASGSEIKYVNVIGNFGVSAGNINPAFQTTGTWYNLMDNGEMIISNVTAPINLQPGEFRIYGNAPANLSTTVAKKNEDVAIFPNPMDSDFQISASVDNLTIYDISGKMVHRARAAEVESKTINVSHLKAGIYLVKVETDSKSKTIKILKR
ncbi:MAG: alpha-amylase family glycosyl hydrolase [Leeuwenhoekiella sp.]